MGDEERGVLEGTTHLARSIATEAGPASVEAGSHLLVGVDCTEGSLRGPEVYGSVPPRGGSGMSWFHHRH
jgi:hypothetical protein